MGTTADDPGLDAIDPAETPLRDATNLRRIIAVSARVGDAEAELRAAVRDGREAGDSWTMIGPALGITRRGAVRRFGRSQP